MDEEQGTPPPESPSEDKALERARFADRVVAYGLDLLILGLVLPAVLLVFSKLGLSPSGPLLLAVWVGGYLAYHTLLNVGGATPGKRIVGVQAFTADGHPLTPGRSLVRALGYLLSGAPLCLGFLWALFHPRHLAWHDMLAGTMVLETRPKGVWARRGMTAAAGLVALLFVVSTVWQIAEPQYTRYRLIANAEKAVVALAALEENHRGSQGTYTSDLTALAKLYGNQEEFFALLAQTMDLSTLSIEAGRDRYTIRARALDDKATALEYASPPAAPGG